MTQWTPSDEQSWSMTKKSIEEDGPVGADFLVRLNFWLNTAEKMMAEDATQGVPFDDYVPLSSANALRKALEIMERELGMIDVFFLGQMLVVIGMYWQHGNQAMRGLSPIELKLAGHSLSVKIAEDNAKAAREQTNSDLAGIIHPPTEAADGPQ